MLGFSAKVTSQDVQMLFIVGEQIFIKEKVSDKSGFKTVKAKYKVDKVIKGDFKGDVIEFLANPIALSKSKKATLYLKKEDDGGYRLVVSGPAYNKEEKKLYAFVGAKLSLEPLDPKYSNGTILMDNAFKAKYKILQDVYGDYKGDTIEFDVYDHYGKPAFSSFENVLLYVVEEEDGKLYHEKYLFSPVFQTKEGKWAGAYESEDYQNESNANYTIKPIEIDFVNGVGFSISDSSNAKTMFPEPYFRIEGNEAVPVMGNYVEDLVRLKLNGILTRRGYIDY